MFVWHGDFDLSSLINTGSPTPSHTPWLSSSFCSSPEWFLSVDHDVCLRLGGQAPRLDMTAPVTVAVGVGGGGRVIFECIALFFFFFGHVTRLVGS